MFFIRLFLANFWKKNLGSPCSFKRKGEFISLRAKFDGNLLRFVWAHAHVRALMPRKSCALGMRRTIKVPDVGFVGVLNRHLSIYHYSNMTLKLSGQIIIFLSFFGLSKKTTPNIEVCTESLGAMLEFDILNVAYSLDLKLCTYMLLLTLTQSILKKGKKWKDVNAGTFLASVVYSFSYFFMVRCLLYCFSLLLLPHVPLLLFFFISVTVPRVHKSRSVSANMLLVT